MNFVDQQMGGQPDQIIGGRRLPQRLGIEVGAGDQAEGLNVHQENAKDRKAAQDIKQADPA